MTDTGLTVERIEEIERGCEGVTPGPWEADEVENEGGHGKFTSYQVLATTLDYHGKAPSLVDTINSERMVIHEESDEGYHSVWDEQGRLDTKHLARLSPEVVRELCELAREGLRARQMVAAREPADDGVSLAELNAALIAGSTPEASDALAPIMDTLVLDIEDTTTTDPQPK